MDINSHITARINEEKDDLGIKTPALADKSGIPYTTLNRRLIGGKGDWSATDIARIANALRIPSSKLLPAEFFQMQPVAA